MKKIYVAFAFLSLGTIQAGKKTKSLRFLKKKSSKGFKRSNTSPKINLVDGVQKIHIMALYQSYKEDKKEEVREHYLNLMIKSFKQCFTLVDFSPEYQAKMLILFVKENKLEVVRLLLREHKMNPTYGKEKQAREKKYIVYPLEYATFRSMAELLIQHKAKVSSNVVIMALQPRYSSNLLELYAKHVSAKKLQKLNLLAMLKVLKSEYQKGKKLHVYNIKWKIIEKLSKQ